MTDTTRQEAEAAAKVFARHGIEFPLPWDGDLDDLERERYEALCEALQAAADVRDAAQQRVTPDQTIADMVKRLRSRVVDVYDGNNDTMRQAADLIQILTRERDEARTEAREHLRLKNELVLKAYPAMDSADRLTGLVKEACNMIADERDSLFQGHQVNGEIIVEDEADQQAADAVAEMDAWLDRARTALGTTETGEDG